MKIIFFITSYIFRAQIITTVRYYYFDRVVYAIQMKTKEEKKRHCSLLHAASTSIGKYCFVFSNIWSRVTFPNPCSMACWLLLSRHHHLKSVKWNVNSHLLGGFYANYSISASSLFESNYCFSVNFICKMSPCLWGSEQTNEGKKKH